MKTYVIILAGGQGKRLWPFTKHLLPKHLLIIDTDTTLLDTTIIRCRTVIPHATICIVTTTPYASQVQAIADRHQTELFVEQESRNTGAAVLFALEQIRMRYPDVSNPMILCIPADQYISHESYQTYRSAVESAQHYAHREQTIAIIGIPQRYNTTRFGFIHCGKAIDDSIYRITRFHEKPTQQSAARYYGNADILWNTGIIVCPLDVLYQLYRTYAPEFVFALQDHTNLPAVPFDTLILEQCSEQGVVVRGSFIWEDLGSLETFIPALPCHDQHSLQSVLGARNNLVYTSKKTIIAGISDLCIIETDDLLVIMTRALAAEPERIAQEIANHKEIDESAL